MLFLVLVATLVTLVAAKIWLLQRFWARSGVPYESYISYLYTTVVRFRYENVYDVLRDYNKRYGHVYGTYQGLTPCLRVATVEAARDALIRRFSSISRRSFDQATGTPLWDNALFALPYQQWKHIRQITGFAFTTTKLRAVIPKVVRLSEQLVDKFVDAARSSGRIDPTKHSQSFAIDCIAAVAFGLNLDATAQPENPFVTHTINLFEPSFATFLLTTFPSLIKHLPFVHFPRKSSVDFFTNFVSFIIKERRQRPLSDDAERNDQDILDMWLREQKVNPSFTDEMIAAQTFLFFVAGFETISYTLYITLYFLTVNPEAQKRAFDEAASIGDQLNETDAPNVDFNKLKFVEACVLEALRLCPTDFVVDRIATEACSVAGVQLKPGDSIQIPLPVIQRDPAYFPDPDYFKPERFLDGTSTTSAFLAFGDGPKVCIGKRLALIEVTIVLCCLLRKVKLERCDATPVPLEFNVGCPFVPYPKKPVVIAVEERS